jgi:hypothetical protein
MIYRTAKILRNLECTYSREKNRIVHSDICNICGNIIAVLTAFIAFSNHQQFIIEAFFVFGETGVWVFAGKNKDYAEKYN